MPSISDPQQGETPKKLKDAIGSRFWRPCCLRRPHSWANTATLHSSEKDDEASRSELRFVLLRRSLSLLAVNCQLGFPSALELMQRWCVQKGSTELTPSPPTEEMAGFAALERERVVVDGTAPLHIRIYSWWILLQSWVTLMLSDHRGVLPSEHKSGLNRFDRTPHQKEDQRGRHFDYCHKESADFERETTFSPLLRATTVDAGGLSSSTRHRMCFKSHC